MSIVVENYGKALSQCTTIPSVIKYIKNRMETNTKNTSGSTSRFAGSASVVLKLLKN